MPEEFEEEELFPEMRKEGRLKRKIAKRTDRSKYKKTDQKKLKKKEGQPAAKIVESDVKEGRVLSVKGLGIEVECDGKVFLCVLRGTFKKERSRKKNLVITGDFVFFQETAEGEGVIIEVQERRSQLVRADNTSRRKQQLLAANIDQVLITVSVVEPSLREFLVDRYIIAAYQGNMAPVVVVNKIDLLENENYPELDRELEKEVWEAMQKAYNDVGIPFVSVSAQTGEGLEALKKVMEGKASLFSGQSGVGKSSLINAMTGLELKTKKVVGKTGKGSHTTTSTQLLPLECGGWCIDSPGIRSFGVWDLKLEEVQDYFEDFFPFIQGCKFSNCRHLQEPECAVRNAVEEGKLSALRYDSYQALVHSILQKHMPR